MTYGEQSRLAYSFLEQLEKSDCPEADLEKEHITSSFIATLSKDDLQEFRQTYESIASDERFKDQESFRTFEDYLYGNVLELQTDVKSEYLLLKAQADDFFSLVDKRRQYLQSRLSLIADKKSSEYKKIQDLLEQTGDIEKEAREQSTAEELIRSAVLNSQNTFLNRMMILGRQDFSRYEWKIHLQDVNARKYINFGVLTVLETDKVMGLKDLDYNLYLNRFEQMIQEYEIIDVIKNSIKGNPLMRDRLHIVEESLAYFEKKDYQLFTHIIVPQIEGFFRLYMESLHISKQTQSIGDVVKEINEKDSFIEYLYFKYDFSDIRNPIAHGDVTDPTMEQAYEILMDLHWIVTKFDSKERDYKKWMAWLEEFSSINDEQERIDRTLDYFNDGLEVRERLNNLKLFLSHQYSKWIKKYGLSEAGECFYETLNSGDLYTSIWNDSTPLKIEDADVDEKLTDFLDKQFDSEQEKEKKDFKDARNNDRPGGYEEFVELMHKHRFCSEDWYLGYRKFLDKQDEWMDNLLKR